MAEDRDGAQPRRVPVQTVSGSTLDSSRALRLIFYLGEAERQAAAFSASLEDAFGAAEANEPDKAWRHLQGAMFAAIIVHRLVTV